MHILKFTVANKHQAQLISAVVLGHVSIHILGWEHRFIGGGGGGGPGRNIWGRDQGRSQRERYLERIDRSCDFLRQSASIELRLGSGAKLPLEVWGRSPLQNVRYFI